MLRNGTTAAGGSLAGPGLTGDSCACVTRYQPEGEVCLLTGDSRICSRPRYASGLVIFSSPLISSSPLHWGLVTFSGPRIPPLGVPTIVQAPRPTRTERPPSSNGTALCVVTTWSWWRWVCRSVQAGYQDGHCTRTAPTIRLLSQMPDGQMPGDIFPGHDIVSYTMVAPRKQGCKPARPRQIRRN